MTGLSSNLSERLFEIGGGVFVGVFVVFVILTILVKYGIKKQPAVESSEEPISTCGKDCIKLGLDARIKALEFDIKSLGHETASTKATCVLVVELFKEQQKSTLDCIRAVQKLTGTVETFIELYKK